MMRGLFSILIKMTLQWVIECLIIIVANKLPMCKYEDALLRITIIVTNKKKNKYNKYDYPHL